MTSRSGRSGRSRERERGANLVEMALITPILLLLLLGVADYGRAFYTYIMVTNAAREGARYGSTHPHESQENDVRSAVTFYTADNHITIDDPTSQITIHVSGDLGEQSMRVQVTVDVPMVLGSLVGLNSLSVSGFGEMPLLADRPL